MSDVSHARPAANGAGGRMRDLVVGALNRALAPPPSAPPALPAAPVASERPAAEPASSAASPVTIALALGWHMVELDDCSSGGYVPGRPRDGLPRLESLTVRQRTELLVDELTAGIHRLAGSFAAAGRDSVSTTAIRDALRQDGDAALQPAIAELHVNLLLALRATEPTLGKAYRLGHALAETCLGPEDRDTLDDAFGPSIVGTKDLLADLSSSLPPHTARAVLLSLRSWESWAADPDIDGDPLDWKRHGPAVRACLRREGQLWHALLTGEKRGEDMLDPHDYLSAADRLVSSSWRAAKVVLRRMWRIVGLVVLVGAAAVVVLVLDHEVLGAVAAALAALGVTGAGVRAQLAGMARPLEKSLWGAELDQAIADAITIKPGDAGVHRDDYVPAIGEPPKAATNLEVLAEFREVVKRGRKRRMRRLLAPDVVMKPTDRERRGIEAALEWLLASKEVRARLAINPDQIVGAGPGLLVTYLPQDGGADVWRVREGRIKAWKPFANRDEARAAVGLPTT
jgi:hypothetical protein